MTDCVKGGVTKFVFVMDEWDYIFHQKYVTEQDKTRYVKFLSNLLKDRAYVEFAYMTGILPIAKYSSGSEINMFKEYTMGTMHLYATYFGFSDEEVDISFYSKLDDFTRKSSGDIGRA